MSLIRLADSFYVGVHDVAAASSWYMEKLGLKQTTAELDEGEGCVALSFPKEIPLVIVLGPSGALSDGATRMLYASNVKKAREWLSSRGVNVGMIEKDRQGTQYFEMRDLEGNVIEVSEEP
jgi:glyoxalase/bleomycin resistance protein/dioxygenase superfamily protein